MTGDQAAGLRRARARLHQCEHVKLPGQPLCKDGDCLLPRHWHCALCGARLRVRVT